MTNYKNAKPKPKHGYIDATDFSHELGEAAGGVTIYASVDDALENCWCAKECGVYKVSVAFKEIALRGKEEPQTLKDMQEKSPRYIERERLRIAHKRAYAEKLKKRAEFLLAIADKSEKELEGV